MNDVIKINGKEERFGSDDWPKTLADLIIRLGHCSAAVVAEVDGRIIERRLFDKTEIKPGQSIELVRFVGGG